MKKQIVSKPLQPNAGIMSWYVKKLQTLCAKMTKECTQKLSGIYGDLSYQIEYTTDESISSQTRIALNELNKKYSDKFSKEAKKLVYRLGQGSVTQQEIIECWVLTQPTS